MKAKTFYHITGNFKGHVRVAFSPLPGNVGVLELISFDDADITTEQKVWFMENIEVFEGRVVNVFTNSTKFKIEKL